MQCFWSNYIRRGPQLKSFAKSRVTGIPIYGRSSNLKQQMVKEIRAWNDSIAQAGKIISIDIWKDLLIYPIFFQLIEIENLITNRIWNGPERHLQWNLWRGCTSGSWFLMTCWNLVFVIASVLYCRWILRSICYLWTMFRGYQFITRCWWPGGLKTNVWVYLVDMVLRGMSSFCFSAPWILGTL